MSNTLELWHLINGEYVHIVQVTEGTQRTYYTNGKQEGPPVDITSPMYAKHEYATEKYTLKTSSGEFERERVVK